MSTLLLRFAGPMQAWDADSRFDVCRTNREPTKSGVIGLLAAALGWRRDAPLDDLEALQFGVRVDREGVLLRDFHMVRSAKTAYVTTRYYLCDAVFLTGVFSEDEALMQRLAEAVSHPAFPLFLGRRACPPEGRVFLGLREEALEEALMHEPSLLSQQTMDPNKMTRMVLEDPAGPARLRDVPVSFSPFRREYRYRAAKEQWIGSQTTAHDPMRELR
ncbi:MAG: type I-E CRISPR-associated protein Cas5/CasD [Eubacteriales bacterium]|nr:type I-E CRISPR-associated protein Cas5/CasD [Eubacteriales bacterium]